MVVFLCANKGFYFGKELIIQVYLEPKESVSLNQINNNSNNNKKNNKKDCLKTSDQVQDKNFAWKSEIDSSSDIGPVFIEDDKTKLIKQKFKLIHKLFLKKTESNLNKDKEKYNFNITKGNTIKISTHLKNEINKNDLNRPKTQLIKHQITHIIQLHNDIIIYKEQRRQILQERINDENLIVQLKMNELKNQLSRRREGQDSETSKIKKIRFFNQSVTEQFQKMDQLIDSYLNINVKKHEKEKENDDEEENTNITGSESETDSKTKSESETEEKENGKENKKNENEINNQLKEILLDIKKQN